MSNTTGGGAPRAVVRYLFTGVAATICTVAAIGSWVPLAVASVSVTGLPSSAVRQRRGRVG